MSYVFHFYCGSNDFNSGAVPGQVMQGRPSALMAGPSRAESVPPPRPRPFVSPSESAQPKQRPRRLSRSRSRSRPRRRHRRAERQQELPFPPGDFRSVPILRSPVGRLCHSSRLQDSWTFRPCGTWGPRFTNSKGCRVLKCQASMFIRFSLATGHRQSTMCFNLGVRPLFTLRSVPPLVPPSPCRSDPFGVPCLAWATHSLPSQVHPQVKPVRRKAEHQQQQVVPPQQGACKLVPAAQRPAVPTKELAVAEDNMFLDVFQASAPELEDQIAGRDSRDTFGTNQPLTPFLDFCFIAFQTKALRNPASWLSFTREQTQCGHGRQHATRKWVKEWQMCKAADIRETMDFSSFQVS